MMMKTFHRHARFLTGLDRRVLRAGAPTTTEEDVPRD